MGQKTRQRRGKEKVNGKVTANGTHRENETEVKGRNVSYTYLVIALVGVGFVAYLCYPTIITLMNQYKLDSATSVDSRAKRDVKTEGREADLKNQNEESSKVGEEMQSKVETGGNVKTASHQSRQPPNTAPAKSAPPSKAATSTPPKEITDFKATYLKTMSPKKIFVDGRRLPPIELLPQKPNNSSVRIFLYDEFLSEQECDGLMRAHKQHVTETSKTDPILCFDSVQTLRKHLKNVNKKIKVTPQVFTPGTTCVNASFSVKLKEWFHSNWSYSTAFYPGESRFSQIFEHRVKEATGMNPGNGGKFQITSYPEGIGYKTHTDCIEDNPDKRDRVATILVYLQDVEEGGETKFPELGIWTKPKKGRALVWNNMDEDGNCEPLSIHNAAKVLKGHKYILQRWYYYKSFYSLGKRPQEPDIPQREPGTPFVSCDEYEHGSCRWYDEWNYGHILEYQQTKMQLI